MYVTGRREDILEYLHNPVNSTKIESILSSHPDLIDVCVVGVRVPPYYDIPTAIVVKGVDSKLTAEDIHLWIKGKSIYRCDDDGTLRLKNKKRFT